MSVVMKNKILIVLLLMLSLCGCDPRYGFIESEFNLSPESRLPKWVDIPPEYTRADLTMKISFYTFGYAKIIIKGPAPDYKLIMEVMGKDRWHPITKEQAWDAFPIYIIAVVSQR